MCEKIRHDLVCWMSLSTPPVSPVLDGDHLILGQGVPRGHLEYPPQLLRGQHGVSLQRGIFNNIIMLNWFAIFHSFLVSTYISCFLYAVKISPFMRTKIYEYLGEYLSRPRYIVWKQNVRTLNLGIKSGLKNFLKSLWGIPDQSSQLAGLF